METSRDGSGILDFGNIIALAKSPVPGKEEKIESILGWHHSRNIVHLQGYVAILFTFIVSAGILILKGEIDVSMAELQGTGNRLIIAGFLASILLTFRKDRKIRTFVHSFMDSVFLISRFRDLDKRVSLGLLRKDIGWVRVCDYSDNPNKRKVIDGKIDEYAMYHKKRKGSK